MAAAEGYSDSDNISSMAMGNLSDEISNMPLGDGFASMTAGFEYFEIVLNVTSQIITIYYFTILIKSSIIHTNMLRLLKLLMFYYTLSQTARLVTAIKEVVVVGNRSE